VRYATFQSTYIETAPDGTTPNAAGAHWDAQSYNGGVNAPNFNRDEPDEAYLPVPVTHNEPALVQLTGNNHTTTGTIRPTSAGLLTGTATITLLHQNHGQTDYEGGAALHGRVRCTLRYANNGASIGAGSPKLGSSEWISSVDRHKLYTITMTGSDTISGNTSSNYNVGVTCADVDRTGSNQWWFTAGNITAHAIYVES
jgi:hypothetical protein